MQPEKLPDRMPMDQKLQSPGMTTEDLEIFCSRFVTPGAYLIKYPNHGWYPVKNKQRQLVPLDHSVVLGHLSGEYWLAPYGPKIARFVAFDIDPGPDQKDIYRKIKDWLKEPLVFQSSSRGGLHVYAHFSPDFPIRTEKLLKIAEATVRVMRIIPAPGKCEIFPASNRGLRLPLGRMSFLLNPESLSPVSTDVATAIRHISTNIHYYSFQDLFPELARRIDERKRLQTRGLKVT